MIRDQEIERIVERLELDWLTARRHIQSREQARRLEPQRRRRRFREVATV